MVKIRLMRMGAKKRPFFRVVVADSRSPRDGRFIEKIGKYHPMSHPSLIEIDEERAIYWLKSGARPTEAVQNLLVKTGIWDKFQGGPGIPVAPPPEKERKPTAEPPAEEAEGEAEAAPAEPAPEAAEAPAEVPDEAAEEPEAPEAEAEETPEAPKAEAEETPEAEEEEEK